MDAEAGQIEWRRRRGCRQAAIQLALRDGGGQQLRQFMCEVGGAARRSAIAAFHRDLVALQVRAPAITRGRITNHCKPPHTPLTRTGPSLAQSMNRYGLPAWVKPSRAMPTPPKE